MPPTSPAERCCVLLQTPLPLKLIVRIKVTARGALTDSESPPKGAKEEDNQFDATLLEVSVQQVRSFACVAWNSRVWGSQVCARPAVI